MNDGKSSAAAIVVDSDDESDKITPEEFIDLYSLSVAGVSTTEYAYGNAFESEYTLVQNIWGSMPVLKELTKIDYFIDDDLDELGYFRGWNLGELQKQSNTIVSMQTHIYDQLGIYVDLTGFADVSFGDQRLQESLKTRFNNYLTRIIMDKEAYKKNPMEFESHDPGDYLSRKKILFIRLFSESALDIIIAKRVNTPSSVAESASSPPPRRGRHTVFLDSDDDEEMESILLRF